MYLRQGLEGQIVGKRVLSWERDGDLCTLVFFTVMFMTPEAQEDLINQINK